MLQFGIGRKVGEVYFDRLEIEPAGLLRIVGWRKGAVNNDELPTARLDDYEIPLLQSYRFNRPDVQQALGEKFALFGLRIEYLVPLHLLRSGRKITLELHKRDSISFTGDFEFADANYSFLFNSLEVRHREHIYGSGLPNVVVHPEVVELARQLPPPLLDFGCGGGALLSLLRRDGTEAYGLELDSPVIRTYMLPEVAPAITLYDGSFPSTFAPAQFRSTICSEVLEHIPNYRSAIQEIVRTTSERVIFTVPDASGIPLGFRHGVVPWHLLEGSHVNFFTQQSLHEVLRPHFQSIEFGRIGGVSLNDGGFYVSLVAICSGPIHS